MGHEDLSGVDESGAGGGEGEGSGKGGWERGFNDDDDGDGVRGMCFISLFFFWFIYDG